MSLLRLPHQTPTVVQGEVGSWLLAFSPDAQQRIERAALDMQVDAETVAAVLFHDYELYL